ncbi:hypothetical protein ULF88_13935 [Halopseudomonas pachastrellae]|nr:hypothetical protein [Halopseudomonas pachastrellae]
MTRILHLSDPHFGTEQQTVMTALMQLVEQQRPTLALLSGDITQRARTRSVSPRPALHGAARHTDAGSARQP